jgi:ankyrin repeat protein
MPKKESKYVKGVIVDEAIVEACGKNDINRLRRLGREGVRVSGAGPLVYAIQSGSNFDTLQCLVQELGADVNRGETEYKTPLFIAAAEGRPDIMRFLVTKLGADVNQGNESQLSLLVGAVEVGRIDLVQLLVGELGADVNKATYDGRTPLFYAAEEGHIAIVQCLVKLKVDVNCKEISGEQALWYAASNGHLEVLRCLLRNGADINHKNKVGETALLGAARDKHFAVAKWLVKAGADPQASMKREGTAADISRAVGASPEQTAYLEAKAHCLNSGCIGSGTKKCQGCMQGRYCGRACHLAHWPAHMADCKRLGAELLNSTHMPAKRD